MLFHTQTSYFIQGITQSEAINDQGDDDSKVKVKNVLHLGHISDTISHKYFILGTKVQPNKAHSMRQVTLTLTLSTNPMQ